MTLRSLLYAIRKLLSKSFTNTLFIEELISVGFLEIYKELLNTANDEDVIIEIGWSLTNIAALYSKSMSKMTELGIHVQLLGLLNGSFEQQHQVLWALGNILNEDVGTRNELLKRGILKYLKSVLGKKTLPLSFVKIIIWVLSSLTRGKPSPPHHREFQVRD
jgi:hypothetical protein